MAIKITTSDFDYSKLLGKIVEVYGNRRNFAKNMRTSYVTMSKKLNGLSEWTQEEIINSCECLGIDRCDIPIYFFSTKN